MNIRTPIWWQPNAPHLLPRYLSPLGLLYGKIVEGRFSITRPYRSKLPIICIGNYTLGGTGKTPIAMKLASMLQSLGYSPSFLSRGYKGKIAGPLLVDQSEHTALDVGDEPLLLADHAPTIIAKNRIEGAWLVEQRNSDFIIMDDGFQNPRIHKDLSIIAIDQDFAIGNGWIFPAGPLRASMRFQVPKTDAVIITGNNQKREKSISAIESMLRDDYNYKGPILHGRLRASEDTDWLREKSILAFAGIGHPEKFFNGLIKAGGQVIRKQPFADHYDFRDADAQSLIEMAMRDDLQLVTTAKDLVRMNENKGQHLRALKRMSRAFLVKFSFRETDEEILLDLIKANFLKRPQAEQEKAPAE